MRCNPDTHMENKAKKKKEFGQTKSYLMIISDDQDRIRKQSSTQLGYTAYFGDFKCKTFK